MNTLKKYIMIAIIIFVAEGFWKVLEFLFYGEVQPRIVGNIIGLLLTISLYYNYKMWYKDYK